MSIKNRLTQLEVRNQVDDFSIVVGSDSEIESYKSMDDESFQRATGLDRRANKMVIYTTDKYGSE